MQRICLVAAAFLAVGMASYAQTPSFYMDMGEGVDFEGVSCEITETVENSNKVWNITMTNNASEPFRPVKAGVRLGIDTYMDRYPEWLDKYFPTLLNCCRTHFYGYMQTPSGRLLAIVSPDPIASWSVDYNLAYQEPEGYWFYGHRISSVNLDLINALPLPEHNPQDRWQIGPGQSLSWKIIFIEMDADADFERTVSAVAGVPMIQMPVTSFSAGEKARFKVYGSHPEIRISDSRGKKLSLRRKKLSDGLWEVTCRLPEPGLYDVEVSSDGYIAEGRLSAHQSWEWVMRKAREGAYVHKQRATSHVESWYGYYSAFIAAKHFPDSSIDAALDRRFEEQMDMLYGTDKDMPLYYEWRIQNTSGTIGMFVDRFEAYGNVSDLKAAASLADWLIDYAQWRDDAYRNRWKTIYTSVIYIAKSILELYEAEVRYAQQLSALGEDASLWRTAARRHYDSAKRAVDQLVASDGDFHTEGEMTFEDGMVSCSALQMGMLALMQTDSAARRHYTDAMLSQLEAHDCLTQLRVPDARRRGGTMRYWEAQYDVHMMPNMFNSPHGWSAWRAYATWYAYLLTGEERWLLETWNAMGAFANLIDPDSGELRWAFVLDPYVRAKQMHIPVEGINPDSLDFGNPHPDMYAHKEFVFGEQYVPMVSSWQTRNSQDNDVHEAFKCLGETFLLNAFVVERENGEIASYNCDVSRKGNRLVVHPHEPQIVNLHVNLRNPYTVVFCGRTVDVPAGTCGFPFIACPQVTAPEPQAVIFDTDMGNDIDDALAMQMLFNYHHRGIIDLKGITISKSNPMAVEFVDGMCRYNGFDDMPLGYVYDGPNPEDGNYLRPALAAIYDGKPLLCPKKDVAASVLPGHERLKRLLEDSEDGSVKLIAVGPLTNISRLLLSDGGVDLVRRKVSHLYVMSGRFAGQASVEWNVLQDVEASRTVYDMCPVPLTACGFEVGKDIKYPATAILNDFGRPESHPLCIAYSNFLKMPYNRPAWDLITVLEAVEPDCRAFGSSAAGRISLDEKGVTTFIESPDGLHYYMTVTPENISKAAEILRNRVKQ
ncbi:MAG: nucleoside hydrolase [Bacteroidales bacterium]|nr:nucleoside hydrolase [Bacteroidales bacterium]